MLACRVSRVFNDVSSAMQRIADNSDRIIVYAHNEGCERPHIHFLIENPQISTDTIKNWIKKDLNTKIFCKTDWSFKQTFGDNQDVNYGYISYMTKGKYEPVFQKGFTESEIKEYKDAWKNPAPKTKNLVQQKLKQKELTYRDIVNITIENLNGSSHPESICQELNKVLIANDRFIGRYKFRDLVDSISARQDNVGWVGQMVSFCRFQN